MKKFLSLLLALIIPFSTLTGITVVQATGNVDISISLVKDPAGSNEAYIERVLYPNSNIGAEIRIKNNGTQSELIKPFAALYFNNILQDIKMQTYTLNNGEDALYQPHFFIPSEDISHYTIKFSVWDNNMQPLVNTVTVNSTYADYYGDSFATATYITESKTIEGKIETASAADYVKFVPQSTGVYTINAYGNMSMTGYLYNSSQSAVANNSGTGNYTISTNLTAGQVYYLKTVGTSAGDYFISIQSNAVTADFDIYEYDTEINGYKDNIIKLCEGAFDGGNTALSQEIYNKYEQAYDTDLLLHEMPDFLNNLSKDTSGYDSKVKGYYASKKEAFETLRQTYIDLYSEYQYSNSGGSPYPPGVIAPSANFEPDGGAHMTDITIPDNLPEEETSKLETNTLSLMSITPVLTITSKTETAVTFTATFPTSGTLGNVIALTDFNQGQTIDYLPYDIDRNGSTNNDWKLTNKSYTISGLVSGGMYYVWIAWSMDGGKTVNWSNSIQRRVQLPLTADGSMTTMQGTNVTAILETDDKANASTTNFNTWLGRMDSVYSGLKELTGYTPYSGKKIQIKSTRQDMNANNPDGVNYWSLTWGWSGNPVLISRPFYRSIMQRLSSGDWGDVTVHELSHDFDMDDWCFDYEVLADLKLSYILQTQSNSKIYRPDTNKYYTGSNIYDFFYTDQADGYQYSFANGQYHNRGMTAIMLRIKNALGSWDAFKRTFRYMADLNDDEYDYIYSSSTRDIEMGKFNIFITKLRDYSGQDIISKLTTSEKNIIQAQYGGTIAYYTAPPPVIHGGGGGGQSNVSLPAGEYTVRRFTPETTGSYSVYTSPFGGTGVSNDTVIEVYSNETMTNLVGSNDDYGGTRFSKAIVNLTAYQTYYIKLRHYNNVSEVHADLKVTKDIVPVALTVNTPVNVQVAALEYSTFSYTPSTSGQYLFVAGQYNGTTQTTNKDIILELYGNAALTNRITSSQYVAGTFPQISANLTAGTTYYLTFMGYLSKAARAQITALQPLTTISGISDVNYNDGQNPMLGNRNKLSFRINRTVSTSETYYIVPSLGWDDTNFYDKTANGTMVTLSGTETDVTINNIPLSSGGGSIVYSKIKVYNNSTVNKQLLWESPSIAKPRSNQAMPTALEFQREASGKNFIYVNSPEYISHFDIVDDNDNSRGRVKLFEQKTVTGQNTMYQTHTSWWGVTGQESYYPNDDYFLDIDFYNPTTNPITVSINNLAYGNNYNVLQNYYSGGVSTNITIPSHEHRLLFETLNAPFLNTNPNGTTWARTPIVLFDFTVNSGNVTVSSLAAYNSNNLHLRYGEENILDSTGETIDSGQIIYYADANGNTVWDGRQGDPRPNESDLYGKYKGIARDQSAWINSNLEYIIDKNTQINQAMPIDLQDQNYPYVARPKNWWMTHINPLNDEFSGLIYTMPESEHRFTYHRDEGGIWNFAYDYHDVRDINVNASGTSTINNKVSSDIITKAALDVASGWKEHFSGSPDELSLGMGAWGATYHYTITINNTGDSSKTAQLRVKNYDNMIYGYKASGASSYSTFYSQHANGGDNDWWIPVSVPLPANTVTTFEVVTMLGGGHGGTHNALYITD